MPKYAIKLTEAEVATLKKVATKTAKKPKIVNQAELCCCLTKENIRLADGQIAEQRKLRVFRSVW